MVANADPTLVERILDGLSGPQKKAVLSNSRFLRIVAGAGAGKTETLTRRVVFLLASGALPCSIVAFTFTEKAAASMKERIYTRVREILGQDSCAGLGQMFTGTMHSYAARLLQDYYGYGNHEVLDENQEVAFLLQNGWEMGFKPSAEALRRTYSRYCLDFLRSQSVVNDEIINIDDVRHAGGSSPFADEVAKYWQLLERSRLLTFGRMIRLAAENLRRDASRLQVSHLIVDEYQDINKAQESLIDALISREGTTCMVVGDPRQCIYEWRGSDPGCFDRFASRGGVESIDLLENRRSATSIVAVANRVAGFFSDKALHKEMTANRTDAGLVTSTEHGTPKDEAAWISGQIQEMVRAGLRYSDTAILLRSVSTSGDEFVKVFEERGIPYLVGGKIGLFKRAEAEAMAALWLWFADHDWYMPYGRAIKADALLNHAQGRWPGGFNQKTIAEFKERLLAGEYDDLIDAYYELLRRLGYLDWDPDAGRGVSMANLGRFSHLLLDFESALWRGGCRARWDTVLRGLAWYIAAYAQSGYGEESPDDLPEVNAVTISTVHQAKGLEWPVVFVPALSDRRFPSSMAGRPQSWLLSRRLFDVERYEGGIEAERRLFYVSITRARDVLVLSRFVRINKSVGSSPFLREAGPVKGCDGSLKAGAIARAVRAADGEVLTLSIQDVISYARCPYSYRMRSVWGYEPRLVRELGFGRSIHHVLRVLAEYAKRGIDPRTVLKDVVERHFFLPFETDAAMRSIKPRVERSIGRYLEKHGDTLKRVEQAETYIEFFLDQHATLLGRVDVIVADEEALEVIDYKTASDSRLDHEAELQLQLYSVGLKETGRRVNRARIMQVLDNESSDKEVQVNTSALDAAREKASECVKGILGRKFQPSGSGNHCGRCDVGRICRHKAKTG